MSLPTAERVTNNYLYGQDSTPTDKVDAALIRSDGTVTRIDIDAVEYMNEGPGRFALAAMSALVKKFFTAPDIPGYTPGQQFALKKADMATSLGLDRYDIAFQQFSYDDGQDDYGERSYIWNSTSFKLSDETLFVIDGDGTRHIENLAVEPRYNVNSKDDKKENFDFETSSILTWLANFYLEPKIDPSHIGRKVIFEIQNTTNIPVRNSYNFETYQAELSQEKLTRVSSWDIRPVSGGKLWDAISVLTDDLWNSGVTRFLVIPHRVAVTLPV